MTVLRAILERGYFPKELPPFFYTELFARFARTKAGKAALDGFKPADNFTECVIYDLARPGHTVRSLAIPHPGSFYRLARITASNFRRLLKKAHKSGFSRSAPVFSPRAYRSIHPRFSMGTLARERTAARAGSRFLVQADVSQFYPSLYTHAVGWAVNPKLRVRSYYQKKGSRSVGAAIDQALMNQQRKVSQGIPIGNDLSFLLAEIVLSQIDSALRVDSKRSYRWFDDYELSCDSLHEAQELLSRLRAQLRRFSLRTSPTKTRIVELPRPADDSWRHAIVSQAQQGLQSDHDFVRYFDNAFRLREEFPEAPVLNYAAGVLFRIAQPAADHARVALSALTQAVLVEPGCAQKVFALLSYWHLNGTMLDQPTLTRTVERLLLQHAAGGVTSDVAWALEFCLHHQLSLGKAAAKVLSSTDDDCIALQALHLHSMGLIGTAFSTKRLEKLAASDVDGPHWLLCYEVARRGYLSASSAAVGTHPLFSAMLASQVAFTRTTLPPYAALLHPGGAPTWLARQWFVAVTGAEGLEGPIAPVESPTLTSVVSDAAPLRDSVADLDDLRVQLLRIHEEFITEDGASVGEAYDSA
jgi:hypothetical protein